MHAWADQTKKSEAHFFVKFFFIPFLSESPLYTRMQYTVCSLTKIYGYFVVLCHEKPFMESCGIISKSIYIYMVIIDTYVKIKNQT